MWAIVQQKKPFSALDRQDFEAYFQFLQNPQPQEFWCSSIFKGPLSLSAQKTAIAIIDSLLGYLVQASYLDFNPISLMRKKLKRFVPAIQTERILEAEEWQAFLNALHALPEGLDKARLRFLVAILFLLGLRIEEVASHSLGHFRQIQGQWWFLVTGKGDKEAQIPVNEHLLNELKCYRKALRLSELPDPNFIEAYPLIPSWRSPGSLSARQMNNLIKGLALKTGIQKLEKMSAHWIRHHSASMQDKAGIRFAHIKANHRHENDQTTRRYIHSLNKERHEDMQKLTFDFPASHQDT